ncbi:MAG: ketopantoate reductase family protein, partial [Pseudomonadota bacterium]|nr:ketopantoate reductase family protein [Pseudomonadota bacterium]
ADHHGPGDILFGARSTIVVGELTPRLQTLHKELQAFEPNAIATNNVWGVPLEQARVLLSPVGQCGNRRRVE